MPPVSTWMPRFSSDAASACELVTIWCAYVENTARGWGIKDPWDEPYSEFIDPVGEFNRSGPCSGPTTTGVTEHQFAIDGLMHPIHRPRLYLT